MAGWFGIGSVLINKDGRFRLWTGVFPWFRLQLFESQLQLFDLLCELLRFTPKLHALQSSDQQLQMLDFAFSREQSLVLSDDERFQRIQTQRVQIRKRRSNHEAEYRMNSALFILASRKYLCRRT